MGLTGKDLKAFLEKHPIVDKLHFGTFFADQVPEKFPILNFIIINTALSTDPEGKHWICIFRKTPKKYELFNSLGENQDWILGNLNFPAKVLYNTTRLQSDTDTCGMFVCSFIALRALNFDLSFKEVLNNYFSTDLAKNELFVQNVYSKF